MPFEFVLAGRYKLLAPLGEGGMATVYRARDLRLNRDVALKILHDDLVRDTSFLARFEREAQIVAALTHPNIVPVFDVGEAEGSHFIVMEYVRGRTLKDLIETTGKVDEVRASTILAPVLDALAYAHDQGLIHRDVKPQNILLSSDGTPRLADFGIAHLADGSTTRTAAILGSAHYLSPEQSRGQEATALSDIYACGVVLYEMLAGKPPFDGPNALAIAHQHLQVEPPPLDTPLFPIAARALAKDPDKRFADADAFAAELRSDVAQTAAHPLAVNTATQPLVASEAQLPAPQVDAPLTASSDFRLRRSARKPYVLAAILTALTACTAYLASTTVWGQALPHYPSAPYAVLPCVLLVGVVAFWLSSRSWVYTLDGDAAVVQWGLLGHHRFGLPLRTISVLELRQSPIDRLLGLGSIQLKARDENGLEQVILMEDVPRPAEVYQRLLRVVSRS